MEELQPRIGQGGQVSKKKVVFVFYCLFVWLVLEARFLKICSVCLSVCLLVGFQHFQNVNLLKPQSLQLFQSLLLVSSVSFSHLTVNWVVWINSFNSRCLGKINRNYQLKGGSFGWRKLFEKGFAKCSILFVKQVQKKCLFDVQVQDIHCFQGHVNLFRSLLRGLEHAQEFFLESSFGDFMVNAEVKCICD